MLCALNLAENTKLSFLLLIHMAFSLPIRWGLIFGEAPVMGRSPYVLRKTLGLMSSHQSSHQGAQARPAHPPPP